MTKLRTMMEMRRPGQWRNMYEVCQELFADYPLATEEVNHCGRTFKSMVLMLLEYDNPQFFVLSYDSGKVRSSYSLRQWGARDIVNIEVDGTAAVPDVIVKVVGHGFPIPHDASLFGWNDRGVVTVLTIFYTKGRHMPRFTSMPFVDLSEPQWPPYVGESLCGRWFWDSHKAGKLVPLTDLIARTSNTVYWVNTDAILGSGCCAVARDVRDQEGPTLRRGLYVYYKALQAGGPLPELTALLAGNSKTDLAQRL